MYLRMPLYKYVDVANTRTTMQTMKFQYFLVVTLLLLASICAANDDDVGAVQVTIGENADDKAIIPISRSKLLRDGTTSSSNSDVVIRLQNQGVGNMKLKLGHGVLVPVEPLKPSHLSDPTSITNSTNGNSQVDNLMKSYIDPISSTNSTTMNRTNDTMQQSLLKDNISSSFKSNESITNQNVTSLISKDNLYANFTNNVSVNQEILPINVTTSENNQDNITLSGKDATSFFDSISQAGIHHEGADDGGDATVVRIEINRKDFENLRQRPNVMKEFKSILKKAINSKQRHDTKPSLSKNNESFQGGNMIKSSPNNSKLVERQKLILAKKTAALSKMAKLASKNLDEIKRLEKEALRQQMLLNKQQFGSQFSDFKKKDESVTNSPIKIFENPSNINNEIKLFMNGPASNTTVQGNGSKKINEIDEVFIKPSSSLGVLQQRNITQSSLGTGAMVAVPSTEPPTKSLIGDSDVGGVGNQSTAAASSIAPKTTTTTTTTPPPTPPAPPPLPPPPPPPPRSPSPTKTTTTIGIIPLTTNPPTHVPPKQQQQKMVKNNDLSPFQSTILENNLNVLSSDQENSSSSSSSTSSSNVANPLSSSNSTSVANPLSNDSTSTMNSPSVDSINITNSSSPYAAQTQTPTTSLEPSRDKNKLNPSSASNSSPQSSSTSSKDEMLVGDSQPVGVEQALKREHSITEEDSKVNEGTKTQYSDNKDDQQQKIFKKKQKIKILILNGDEEIPEKLRLDKRVHMIDTDTELGQQNAFKKELCNGIGYVKCLERSSFEADEQNHQRHLESPTSPGSPEMIEPLHEHSSYRHFDSEPYHDYEDDFTSHVNKEDSKYHDDGAGDEYSSRLNSAKRENLGDYIKEDFGDSDKESYDHFNKERDNVDSTTTSSNIMEDERYSSNPNNNEYDEEERDSQNMEFAIQSAAADAARTNRLRSFAHEQAFLNSPVGARIDGIESDEGGREGNGSEDLYTFKRNRNLKWKKKINVTASALSTNKQRGS